MDEKEARRLVERIESGSLRARDIRPRKLMDLVLWLDEKLLKTGSELAGVRVSLKGELGTRLEAEKRLAGFTGLQGCGHLTALEVLDDDGKTKRCLTCWLQEAKGGATKWRAEEPAQGRDGGRIKDQSSEARRVDRRSRGLPRSSLAGLHGAMRGLRSADARPEGGENV